MKTLRAVSLILTCFCLTSTSFAKEHKKNVQAPAPIPSAPMPQTYFVHEPASSSLSCDQVATELGRRLGAAANVTVTQARCTGRVPIHADDTVYQLDSIAVTYTSLAPVKKYSASISYASVSDQIPYGPSGFYAKYSDCVNDIESQKNVFERETKLTLLGATCYQAQNAVETLYTMRLDAFGTPAKRLYVFSPSTGSYFDLRALPWIKNLLTSLGASVYGQTDRALFYYSAKPLPLHSEAILSFGYRKTCENQLDKAQKIFARRGLQALVQCRSTTGDADMGSATNLYAIWSGFDSFSHNVPLTDMPYYTFDECVANEARVFESEKRQGHYVLGAFCRESVLDNQTYVIDILEEL